MQDLSHLSKGWPSYGASMNGGNMVSESPQGALDGSKSEQTADAVTHDMPDLEYVPGAVKDRMTPKSKTVYTPAPLDWKMVN